MSDDPQLRLELPARAENVIVVRQAVAGLGEALGLSEQRLADLKTVVTEACNNVVLHAYDDGGGPLEVEASAGEEEIKVIVADRGHGFRPQAEIDGATLGLGLPLMASLSDGFEIKGGAGEGTQICVRLSFETPEVSGVNGTDAAKPEGTALSLAAGEAVRPVLARVIGALAARADFSLDRLADTVLLGDAVSSHAPDDFAGGLVGISIRDADGSLHVRIGPLVPGGGQRVLEGMDIPAGKRGSLRKLARSMEVSAEEAPEGSFEYLEIEVAK